MRIAVIGDIHGNLVALEAVLADCRARGAERYLVLGDLAMKGPRPSEVLETVRQLPGQVIQGNTDQLICRSLPPGYKPKTENEKMLTDILKWGQEQLAPEDFQYLSGLPKTTVEEINGHRLLLVHGSPRNNQEGLLPETAPCDLAEMLNGLEEKVVLAAHTHFPMVRDFAGYQIINAGSVGFPLDGNPRACYCLLEISPESVSPAIVRVDYDIEKTIADAEKRGFPHVRAYAEGLATGGAGGLR
ncbi:MAG: metallophosphoesterase family protein [Bacillota bacterium]